MAMTDLHPPPPGQAAAGHIERLRIRIEQATSALSIPEEPRELYEPVRYVLEGGGKRLRPVLLLLAAEAAGADSERALPAALATEVFHNFTLVHDDIMDNAVERRGRPSVHVRWDESTAILSGDLMMGMSYRLLAQTEGGNTAELIDVFHRMVVAVCEGQALDKSFETRSDVSLEDYLDMISRKTGALIECVMELGGRIAAAEDDVIESLVTAGREMGRAFQIQDDLLDLTASDAGWGKTIGGDLIEGKKAYLLLAALGAQDAEQRAWFQRIVDCGGLAPDLVHEARQRLTTLGVLDQARDAVHHHSEAAVDALETLPSTAARDTIVWLARSLASRVR